MDNTDLVRLGYMSWSGCNQSLFDCAQRISEAVDAFAHPIPIGDNRELDRRSHCILRRRRF
jgi:hypothetical protein